MAQPVAQRSPHFQLQAPITHSPHDVTLLFIRFLPGPQIARLRRVCKYFAQVVNNENLWVRLCQQDLPGMAIPSNVSSSLHYKTFFPTEHNWRKGRYVYQRLSNCGTTLSLRSDQLFCEGPNLSIQIWNLRNSSCRTLEGFPNDDTMDTCIHDDALLICGANSGPTGGRCFKVWDRTTGKLLWNRYSHGKVILDGLRLLIPHLDYNSSTQVSTGRIDICDKNRGTIHGSILDPELRDFYDARLKGAHVFGKIFQNFVKYWNKDTREFVRRIGTADDPLFAYKADGKNLVCGFRSGKIIILNQDDGTLIRELVDPEGEIKEVVSVKFDEQVVLALCLSFHVACWSKESGKLLFKIKIDTNNPHAILFETKIKLTGSVCILGMMAGGNLELRDKLTGSLLKTCIAGERWLKILQIDDYRIFTLCNKRLKIWDKRTGDLLFMLNDVQCKVFGDRMVIENSDKTVDVCDFSDKPEIPFPHKGQLPVPVKP